MIDINELRRLAQAALAAPDGLSAEWMDRLGQFQEAADASVVSELLDRLEAAESDGLEQARLNGMGAEREAALLAKLEAAEKERDALRTELNEIRYGVAVAHDTIKALRAKIKAMEQQKPVAWKYEIAAYADHRTDVGVVLNKRELSSAIPAEQITWTPLFAFDGRQTPEASRTAIEMIDRPEAAEKAVAEAYQRGYTTGQEEVEKERDALRAKITEMERQEPYCWTTSPPTGHFSRFKIEVDQWVSNGWETVPLYLAPGAQPAPSASEDGLPDRDSARPAEQQGLFRKFVVRRTDGSDAPGGKHYGCRYFVLDVDHDKHAVAALTAYAKACETTHPDLAKDLREKWGAQPAPSAPEGWLRAIDEALVVAHIGVANESDTYEQAREKLNNLIGWHTDVATDPAVNGGYKLVPIEPTPEMVDAIEEQWMCGSATGMARREYLAALAAAPGAKCPDQ